MYEMEGLDDEMHTHISFFIKRMDPHIAFNKIIFRVCV